MSEMADHARAAFLQACRLDVEVRKPGNVSVASAGHGMVAAQFVASSEAAAPALFERGAPVGRRIEGAMRASLSVAGCNTNLGIVLLVAPLARALELLEGDAAALTEASMRASAARVLAGLDLADAPAAYRAIALANPGGLGRTAVADVTAGTPTVTLLQAMRLAAQRDRIARQYADGYAELYAIGLPAWRAGLRRSGEVHVAMLESFVAWLASAPDSHIVRKHGAASAHTVTAEAARWQSAQSARAPAAALDVDAIAAWDERLKARGFNPGTSADLSVLTAFVALLMGD
jgi:triphosphoribosyl-dephospho-CoA synthase